jgi:hypothetical protein
MKMMAASFALGGIGSRRLPPPRGATFCLTASLSNTPSRGCPLYFATAMPLRNSAVPLFAETHQGRPTKLEGNPSYAAARRWQLAVRPGLRLRSLRSGSRHAHTKGGAAINNAAGQRPARQASTSHLLGQRGSRSRVSCRRIQPRQRALACVAKLKQKFPKAIWAEYEPVLGRAARRRGPRGLWQGRQAALPLRQAAKRMVSLDADFFLSSESGFALLRPRVLQGAVKRRQTDGSR